MLIEVFVRRAFREYTEETVERGARRKSVTLIVNFRIDAPARTGMLDKVFNAILRHPKAEVASCFAVDYA